MGSTVLANATPASYVTNTGGIYYNLINGDPGNYILLQNLTTTAGNNTYLVQVINNNCGGTNSRWVTFCMGLYNPASNTTPSGASSINSCGTKYNGTTQDGYYPTGSGNGFNNIDNNTSTTCSSGCSTTGQDVPFVIDNPSYFTFCATANGTYNVNFDVNSCTQTLSGAQGSQMAILIGSATSMTYVASAPNPMLPSTPVWTSPNFSLATGQCAYLLVDGFSGDACTYSYTLNAVGGGCFLPIELLNYTAYNEGTINYIGWTTATEKNNAYFTLEKSQDGIHYEVFEKIKGAGDSYIQRYYEVADPEPYERTYYLLSQTDYNGTTKKLGIVVVDNTSIKEEHVQLTPNPTSDDTYLYIYSKVNRNINILLSDVSGNVLYTKNTDIQPGDNKIELYTSKLEKGLYFVTIQTRFTMQVLKLMVTRWFCCE